MKIALSPCPNDTFLFYAWIHQKISSAIAIEPTYADVEMLNAWAIEGRFPVTKLSFAAYLTVQSDYQLLPVGAALGFGVGPKLIAQKPIPLENLKKVAIPGQHSTAHLIFDRLLHLPIEKVFCRYDQVCELLAQGAVDAGLIIHETRFTFRRKGFIELVDLGSLWEQATQLPLPLGAIAIRRDLEDALAISLALQASLRYSHQHRIETLPFLLQHAQEKDVAVVLNHVDTYVTEESLQLSPSGIAAVEELLQLPHKSWLYSHPLCSSCST